MNYISETLKIKMRKNTKKNSKALEIFLNKLI